MQHAITCTHLGASRVIGSPVLWQLWCSYLTHRPNSPWDQSLRGTPSETFDHVLRLRSLERGFNCDKASAHLQTLARSCLSLTSTESMRRAIVHCGRAILHCARFTNVCITP